MKRFFVFYCFVISQIGSLFAQGEVDKQKTLFYRDEKSGGILLNSNGFGLSGIYAKRLNAANKILYNLDFVYIKHPKEEVTTSQYDYNSGNFVFGKKNLALNLRFGYGKQKEIFRKFDVGGISVRKFYAYGASLAMLKPIYYNVNYGHIVGIYEIYNTNIQKFDRNIYINPGLIDPGSVDAYIDSRASFFKGFSELKFVPGAFVKLGLSFEYSRYDQILHAIETGLIIEGFTQKLPIMDTKENYQLYFTLFLSYRIGKVFDPNAPKKEVKKDDFLY